MVGYISVDNVVITYQRIGFTKGEVQPGVMIVVVNYIRIKPIRRNMTPTWNTLNSIL
jgi:hypothetical protein